MSRFNIIFLVLLFASLSAQAQNSVYENTFGVETTEDPGISIYLAPQALYQGLMSPDLESSPKLGFSITGGLLVSSQLMLETSFRTSELGLGLNGGISDLFVYSKRALDLGVRLYLFDQGARLRPYLAGGGAYSFNRLSFDSSKVVGLKNDEFSINQLSARGGMGLELNLTRTIVLNAQFGVEGVIAYSGPKDLSQYYLNQIAVANSLSRAMAYTLSAGLGFYL